MMRPLFHALRAHQWVKNLLVFVAPIMGHAFGEKQAWISSGLLFVSFCFAASSIYVVNDLTDLDADRLHPRKRLRPFASGALSAATGLALAAVLLVLALASAAMTGALAIVVAYVVIAVAYSLLLKKFAVADVFVLAGLYTLRVIGGGFVSGHDVSVWLLAFSCFFFLSLALGKRVEELLALVRAGSSEAAARRGYRPGDVAALQLFGCCAAFAASVVLALFVGSSAAAAQYGTPQLLWGLVPLLLFWQCRLWLTVMRGEMQDDPVLHAVRDKASWIVAALVMALLLAATR